MIHILPNLIILNICNFLKLPDILNLLKSNIIDFKHIENFKKKLVYRDTKNQKNYIFKFSLSYLITNYIKIISELNYIRNNFFIDYTFCSDSYMSYISYIESREWFIIEYYLNWFQSKKYSELPEFCEIELSMESFEHQEYKSEENDVNLIKKIKKYISCDKNYQNIEIYNSDFSTLKNLNFII